MKESLKKQVNKTTKTKRKRFKPPIDVSKNTKVLLKVSKTGKNDFFRRENLY